MTQKELDKLQEKALKQLKSGDSLFGKDGAFAPMLQSFIEAALEAEMWMLIWMKNNAKAVTSATAKVLKRLKVQRALSKSKPRRTGRAASIHS